MRLPTILSTALLALALPLTAQAQSAAGASGMTDAEREALHGEIRAYILENPEVILEAIQIIESRREEAAETEDRQRVALFSEVLFNDQYSYVGGNPDGDITIVEFSDYRCGFCKRAHPIVERLLETDPNLRLVIKEFPILGEDSVAAGRMAMAAHDLDAALYPALNDALMTHEGDLTEATSYRIASDVGYDIPTLKARAQSDEIGERLGQTYELAQNLGLQGTPSFVIGGEIVRGFLQIEDMREIIAEQRNAQN